LKNAISEYDNALNYVEKHPEPKTTSGKNKLREKENEIALGIAKGICKHLKVEYK
jgi:hypothetical protein